MQRLPLISRRYCGQDLTWLHDDPHTFFVLTTLDVRLFQCLDSPVSIWSASSPFRYFRQESSPRQLCVPTLGDTFQVHCMIPLKPFSLDSFYREILFTNSINSILYAFISLIWVRSLRVLYQALNFPSLQLLLGSISWNSFLYLSLSEWRSREDKYREEKFQKLVSPILGQDWVFQWKTNKKRRTKSKTNK